MAYTTNQSPVINNDSTIVSSSVTISNSGDTNTYLKIRSDFQGTVEGYASGGYTQPSPFFYMTINVIDRFSFATNANTSDVGDLTQRKESSVGQQY